MPSMTYGTMPTKKAFKSAFSRSMGSADHLYEIRAGLSGIKPLRMSYGDTKSFDCDELYTAVKGLVAKWNRGNEEAGEWASSILETLGFEWI